MGGKLSEGINFKDSLARTLMIIGLPFSNNQSIEIKERMKYWTEKKIDDFNGQIYYENLCIKVLNQALGRCIRHKDDWACIVLVDQRFGS